MLSSLAGALARGKFHPKKASQNSIGLDSETREISRILVSFAVLLACFDDLFDDTF